MATDFSCEAAHERRRRFRFNVLLLLFMIFAELGVVAIAVVRIAKQTEASPIEKCMTEYHLTAAQCDQVENGVRIPLDGSK